MRPPTRLCSWRMLLFGCFAQMICFNQLLGWLQDVTVRAWLFLLQFDSWCTLDTRGYLIFLSIPPTSTILATFHTHFTRISHAFHTLSFAFAFATIRLPLLTSHLLQTILLIFFHAYPLWSMQCPIKGWFAIKSLEPTPFLPHFTFRYFAGQAQKRALFSTAKIFAWLVDNGPRFDKPSMKTFRRFL